MQQQRLWAQLQAGWAGAVAAREPCWAGTLPSRSSPLPAGHQLGGLAEDHIRSLCRGAQGQAERQRAAMLKHASLRNSLGE